ncbi:MAG: hypothetical protein FJ271_25580 [Planctomycetes bacterium]|nr:hypothetical protein [Planctomycetota bacterium]
MKHILSLALPAALLAGAGLLADEPLPANPLLDQFLEKGIDVPGYGAFKLPKPTVRDGMTPAQLDSALKKAAGSAPVRLFLEKGLFKPITLKVDQVYDADKVRQAQYVKLHFVAHGKLETVLKKNLLTQLIGGAKGKSNALDADQLKKRDLTLLKSKGLAEQYDILNMELLEKVSVSGITRSLKTTSDTVAYSTTILDDRFVKDAQYPNVWQHITAEGSLIGKPSPYSGMGGYVVALELPNPKGALYMEMHYILHEPKAWFGGPDVLRSKLPILIRDNVQEFRRKLAKEG